MIQDVLRDIGGVGLYGIISICLFFAVFTGAVLWACLQDKRDLDEKARLPLGSDSTNATISE